MPPLQINAGYGPAWITIKDDKENFPNKISCRLVIPSKSEIGKISKTILDRINKDVIKKTKFNQWKDNDAILTWFSNIKGREKVSFITFDIDSFNPSITHKLFNRSIEIRRNITSINVEELEISFQARRTILFSSGNPWVKKNGDEDFDVPMACYDGAKVCELVGSFVLNCLEHVFTKGEIGLYRDDGLGIIRNASGPEIDRKRKRIIDVFKQYGLTNIMHTNLKSGGFLRCSIGFK